jgi:hypothetical protein
MINSHVQNKRLLRFARNDETRCWSSFPSLRGTLSRFPQSAGNKIQRNCTTIVYLYLRFTSFNASRVRLRRFRWIPIAGYSTPTTKLAATLVLSRADLKRRNAPESTSRLHHSIRARRSCVRPSPGFRPTMPGPPSLSPSRYGAPHGRPSLRYYPPSPQLSKRAKLPSITLNRYFREPPPVFATGCAPATTAHRTALTV